MLSPLRRRAVDRAHLDVIRSGPQIYALPPAATTGTTGTVHFLVDAALVPGAVTAHQIRAVAAFDWLTTTAEPR